MKNKWIKKYIAIVIFLILIVFFFNKVYANESIVGKTSKAYQEWLELPEEERKNTIAPLPYNISLKQAQGMEVYRNIARDNLLPSRYDLRDYIQIERKDQMKTNLCWAFTSNSCVETNLALRGEKYNFSERHYEYDTAYLEGKEDSLNRKIGDGGSNLTAFLYLSRGSGPILEEDMPFENNENPIQLSDLPKNVAIKKVDDMITFPSIQKKKDNNGNIRYLDGEGNEYTLDQVKEIRNQVKEHIVKNGAVFGCIKAPTGQNAYNYKLNGQSSTADHAITIIGWDDNYNKNNFNIPAKEDGAYIILNSWGEVWGEQGIGYVSYEDFQIETQMSGIVKVSDIEYDNIYQYDLSEMFGLFNTKYVANDFIANDNEILTEVMVGAWGNQTCNIYLVIGDNSKKIASNVKLNPGYNTIKLSNEYRLSKGTKFRIEVEQTGNENPCIGAEMEMNFFGNFTNVVVNEGETFVSYNGQDWIDAASAKMNASIKAFTKKENKYLKLSKVDGTVYENIGGNLTFSINTNYTEKDKNLDIKVFKDEVDVTNIFNISGNKIRGNGAFIKLGCPPSIKKGKYTAKVSLSGLDSVSIPFTILTQGEEPEEAKLDEIKVTKMPNKTVYNEGEIFDPEGMEVTAYYTDGSSKIITNYVISPSIALTENDKKITIYYTEYPIKVNTSINITVNKKSQDEEELVVKIKNIVISNDSENVTVRGIQPNTNLKTLIKEDIETNGDMKIFDKNNNEMTGNEIIFTTDDVITLLFTKQKQQRKIILTTVVNGDVNGDSKADFADMLAINKHRLNKKKLQGAYLLAGDVNYDGKSDFTDMLKINKFRLDKITNL